MVATPTWMQTLLSSARADLYGHAHYRGPARDRPNGGSAVTGGNAHDLFSASNGNNDGAGSDRAQLAAAIADGGGTVWLYNGVAVLASELALSGSNLTLIGAKRDARLQSRGIKINNAQNVIVYGVTLQGIAGGRDNIQSSNSSLDSTPVWIHAYTARDWGGADDACDIRINVPQDGSKDFTVGMVRFICPEGTGVRLCYLGTHGDTPDGKNSSKYSVWSHHTYYQPNSQNRAIDFREPLHGGKFDSGDPKHYHSNCVHIWRQDGATVRNGAHMLSQDCTFDGDLVSGSNNINDGQYNSGGDGKSRVESERLLNGAGVVENDASEVTLPASLGWSTYDTCSDSAAHDEETQGIAGANGVMLELSGTARGQSVSTINGTYYDIGFPFTLPSGTSFNALRQDVIDLCSSPSGDVTGAELFSGVAQIVRHDATTIRATVDQTPTAAGDTEIYFLVPIGDFWYGTPDYAPLYIGSAVPEEPPPDPDPPEEPGPTPEPPEPEEPSEGDPGPGSSPTGEPGGGVTVAFSAVCDIDFKIDGELFEEPPFSVRLVTPQASISRTTGGKRIAAVRYGRRAVVQWGETFVRGDTLAALRNALGSVPQHTIEWTEPDGNVITLDSVNSPVRTRMRWDAPGFYEPVILTFFERPPS